MEYDDDDDYLSTTLHQPLHETIHGDLHVLRIFICTYHILQKHAKAAFRLENVWLKYNTVKRGISSHLIAFL